MVIIYNCLLDIEYYQGALPFALPHLPHPPFQGGWTEVTPRRQYILKLTQEPLYRDYFTTSIFYILWTLGLVL